MPKSVAVLSIILSWQAACCADVTSPQAVSDDKADQCLIQKKRQVARSSTIDEKPQSGHRLATETQADSLSQVTDEVSKQKVKGKADVSKSKADALKKADHHKAAQNKKTQQSSKDEKKSNDKFIIKKSHHKKHKAKRASLAQLSASSRHTLNKSRSVYLDQLPENVLALGYELFKTDGAIEGAVENSIEVDVTYAGVQMKLRMNKFDDAVKRVGEEASWFSYDLDTLTDDKSDDMINMLDVGGNYGVITIAAMKKHPNNLRVITVEPIPETFFFLKWNLHINGVAEIDADALDDKHTPGVLALHRGSAGEAGQDLHFCAYPWSSMNSKVCDCTPDQDNCHIVPSTTIGDLTGMFGHEPIHLVKMDCEGCEEKSLPALAESHISERVRRLAGELHLPDHSLEKLACQWDHGKFMKKCQRSKKNENDIECDVPLSCPE